MPTYKRPIIKLTGEGKETRKQLTGSIDRNGWS